MLREQFIAAYTLRQRNYRTKLSRVMSYAGLTVWGEDVEEGTVQYVLC